MAAKRIDVVSDTHGRLSDELLAQLQGADAIVHAGDMCSPLDFDVLRKIAPTYMCLGNNDWAYEYNNHFGKLYRESFQKNVRVLLFGLKWELCHYRERLDLSWCDIAICGHTHRPLIQRLESGQLLMNPGSRTFPRGGSPYSFGRIWIQDDGSLDAELLELPRAFKKRFWD